MYMDTYAQYVMCGWVYMEAAAECGDHKDGAQRARATLLPLLRLRVQAYPEHHNMSKLSTWLLHCADPVVRLGKHATFLPLSRTVYLLQRNGHTVGRLAQYMMAKLGWRVFAFRTEVPHALALQAEALAVPMNKWFKPA